jgi:hypothetical protein
MAIISNAVSTYATKAATGGSEHPEDVSTILYNLDPSDVPIVSAAGKSRSIHNTLFEWVQETLSDRDDTAVLEGDETTRAASSLTSRSNNVAMILSRNATTTGTQEALRNFTKSSQMGHQMARKSKELKRDVEFAITRNKAKNVGAAGTARQTATLLTWFSDTAKFNSNADAGATAATGDGSDTWTRSATTRAVSEAQINSVMESIYDNGGDPTMMFVSPGHKVDISAFTGRSNTREMINKGTVGSPISVYASDFGDIKVVPCRTLGKDAAGATGSAVCANKDIYILDPAHYRLAMLRNYSTFELSKIGDASTRQIIVEFGLQVDNSQAHGLITDLTT